MNKKSLPDLKSCLKNYFTKTTPGTRVVLVPRSLHPSLGTPFLVSQSWYLSLGTPGLGTSSLGSPGLGSPGLGTLGLGTLGLGTCGLGTPGLGTRSLGTCGLGTRGLGNPDMDTLNLVPKYCV